MAYWEKDHIAEAFAFELDQVENEEVRAHVMNELLVNVADELAQSVSAQTGIAIAPMGTPEAPTPSAPDPSGPLRPRAKDSASQALSLDKPALLIKGRKIALLAGDGVDADQLKVMKGALIAQGCVVELIAARAGVITDSDGKAQKVNRAALNAPSVIYDGAVVLGGDSAEALSKSGLAIHFVNEAFRHGKPIASIGNGNLVMKAAKFPKVGARDGVIEGDGDGAIEAFVQALHQHRFPRRSIGSVPA
jgi:catalase